MEFNEFLEEIKNVISDKVGSDVDVFVNSIIKNNDVRLSGLVFKKAGVNAAPTVYMQHFYEQYLDGSDINDIADKIIEIYVDSSLKDDFSADFYMNYDNVKDTLFCKLVSFDKNHDVLENAIHEKYLDLAVTVYCSIDSMEIGNASIQVRYEHLRMWDKTPSEVIAVAKSNTFKNMNFRFRSICEVLESMNRSFEGVCNNDVPMYVATNETGYFGAVVMLDANKLKEYGDYIGSDYYIIPSSIHEIIIFPVDIEDDISCINMLVREVNASELSEEDVLSDHVYRYCRDREVLIF